MAIRNNLAEEIFDRVLQKLKEEKVIKDFIHSVPNDILDMNGIDFLIILTNGYAVPIQIKTDSREVEQKIKNHQAKYPEIKFLICVETHRFRRQGKEIYKKVEQDIRSVLF